jgi:hypothetical protein
VHTQFWGELLFAVIVLEPADDIKSGELSQKLLDNIVQFVIDVALVLSGTNQVICIELLYKVVSVLAQVVLEEVVLVELLDGCDDCSTQV